jgi:uncharacterized protein (DUF1697 family)
VARKTNAPARPALAVFAAFLRAVNVGGTGKLPMADLKRLCTDAGFVGVTTYVQSGNVVLASALAEEPAKARLEAAIAAHVGARVAVFLRARAELDALLEAAWLGPAERSRLLVYFLDAPVAAGELAAIRAPGGEELRAAGRDVLVHYPEGVGVSKLRLPFASRATGRNMNTLAKMITLVAALEATLAAS